MKNNGKPVQFEIPELDAGPIIDLGPIIEPPFVDGITREVKDTSTDLTNVNWEVLPDLLPDEDAKQALTISKSDPRVVAALGRRWEFIGVGVMDNKHRDRPDLRVVWYSYDTDVTVEAITNAEATEVRDVRVTPRQPMLTPGEEKRANDIVAASNRLPGARDGRGIIVEEVDRGSARYGHRLVDLRFDPDGTRLPRWWAVVDLSTGELVDGGDVPGGGPTKVAGGEQ